MLEQLAKVTKQNDIVIVWIKAHANFEGNERADELANKGAKGQGDECHDWYPPPQAAIYKAVKDSLWRGFAKQWERHTEARQTKIFAPVVRPSGWIDTGILRSCDRAEAGDIVRFMTGHTSLARHLSIREIQASKKCTLCDNPDYPHDESPEDWLEYCPVVHDMLREMKCWPMDRFWHREGRWLTGIIQQLLWKIREVVDHI